MIGSIDTAEALLLYVQSQGLASDYIGVPPDLKPLTRGNYRDHDERFIIHAARLPSLRQALDAAEAAYRSDGLASLEHVVKRVPDADVSTLRNLLRCHRFVWSQDIDGVNLVRLQRQGVLRSQLRGQNLRRRVFVPRRHPFPVDRQRLDPSRRRLRIPARRGTRSLDQESPDFAINDGIASYLGETQPPDGLEIQQAAALTGKPGRLYTEILSGFANLGVQKPSIDKLLYASPLVYVDKSQTPYRFTYVTDLELASETTDDGDNIRYDDIHERLRQWE